MKIKGTRRIQRNCYELFIGVGGVAVTQWNWAIAFALPYRRLFPIVDDDFFVASTQLVNFYMGKYIIYYVQIWKRFLFC